MCEWKITCFFPICDISHFLHRKIPGSADCNRSIRPENKEIFQHIIINFLFFLPISKLQSFYLLEVILLISLYSQYWTNFMIKASFHLVKVLLQPRQCLVHSAPGLLLPYLKKKRTQTHIYILLVYLCIWITVLFGLCSLEFSEFVPSTVYFDEFLQHEAKNVSHTYTDRGQVWVSKKTYNLQWTTVCNITLQPRLARAKVPLCSILYLLYMPKITCLQDHVYIPMHMFMFHVYLCVLTFMMYIRLNYDCVMLNMCFCAVVTCVGENSFL
jgi:hypothetical protein